ncbi:MAG TPA: aspartyl beta-hydroxylase [Caulobacteraceae bacterium]|nr:aspartyl beta-hydroxylase [Caulobacteraceae bacterium]
MDGEGRSKDSGPAADGPPGPGWMPARVWRRDAELLLDWVWLGQARLTEPFYEESIARASGGPRPRLSTPLAAVARPSGGLAPSGLIFHMSRCGSTLVSQMLAASSANIVVSEAPPIDGVVRAGLPQAERLALLRAMVLALGQVRNAGETRYFIKLDSWHACALPLFRAAFPATPWVFLYREPSAVMVSHARRVGMQMVADLVRPAFLGLDAGGQTWGEDYHAQVLGAICGAAARGYAEGGGLLVNYDELPQALVTRILPHFGVAPAAGELAAMSAAARFDAKSPDVRFTPDAEAKRLATTPAIDAAIERRVAGVFAQLETLRRAELG